MEKPDITTRKNEFVEFAKTICPRFIIDDNNRKVIANLFDYFTGEIGELDSSKGIWLEGPLGTGKTTLLHIFSQYLIQMRQKSFLIHSSPYLTTQYGNGEISLDAYTYCQNSIPNYPVTMAFDELGRETIPVYRYKTPLNVMQFILHTRYTLWQKQQIKTHITTNLDGDELEQLYGDFIRDRRRESFNIISLLGTSRR